MRLVRTFGLAAGLAMVGSMAFAGSASAKPIEHTDFHDEFTQTIDNFCDVSGLTVQLASVVDGRFLLNPHGPDGLAYAHTNTRFTDVFTNLANQNTVTEVGNFVNKDLRVTDNGDGTLTILVLEPGAAAAYGPDGKAIARVAGQERVEFLVDHGGTPTDPFDDVILEEGLVKGPTGRTDDVCAAVVPVLVG
jgi:hypothetical protein